MPIPIRRLLVSCLLLFFWLNLVSTQEGSVNAHSRFLTLHAISRDHTFAIDPYIVTSPDWARSRKDGHYYSNKAPGTVLFALPAYLVIDRLAYLTDALKLRKTDGTGLPEYFRKTATSFITQMIPCALLAVFLCRFLVAAGLGAEPILFFLLAFLFGNVSSFFMNNLFGHGLAVIFLMGGLLSHLERRPFLAAFFFGWALLTDYSSGPLLLLYGMAALIAQRVEWTRRFFTETALGALLPGALWVWYHTHFFGSPLALPISQESPTFEVADAGKTGLLRVIGILPNLEVVGKLMFGPERGMLSTQPWVFVSVTVLPFLLRRRAAFAPYGWAVLAAFGLLLYLNASFPLWHGGGSPGPRYLSLAFPPLAFFTALYWGHLPRPARISLWLGLLVALAFRLLVSTGDMLQLEWAGLWHYYWEGFVNLRRGSEQWKMAAILLGIAAISFRHYWLTRRRAY